MTDALMMSLRIYDDHRERGRREQGGDARHVAEIAGRFHQDVLEQGAKVRGGGSDIAHVLRRGSAGWTPRGRHRSDTCSAALRLPVQTHSGTPKTR